MRALPSHSHGTPVGEEGSVPSHPWPALALVMFSSFCQKCANSAKSMPGWAGAKGWAAVAGRDPGGGTGALATLPTQGSNPAMPPGCSPSPAGGCPGPSLLWPHPTNARWRPQGSPCPALSPRGAGGCMGQRVGRQQPPGGPGGLRAEPEAAPGPLQPQPAGRSGERGHGGGCGEGWLRRAGSSPGGCSPHWGSSRSRALTRPLSMS